jgi:hypothetical protein
MNVQGWAASKLTSIVQCLMKFAREVRGGISRRQGIVALMVGGERTTCASTASSLHLRRANARRPLTHILAVAPNLAWKVLITRKAGTRVQHLGSLGTYALQRHTNAACAGGFSLQVLPGYATTLPWPWRWMAAMSEALALGMAAG